MENQHLAKSLYDAMDADRKGLLNLENMRKLYESVSADHKDLVRDKLRKFVIENQKFTISKEEFIDLFPKPNIPCVHINLGHLQETKRLKELSQTELKTVISKRLDNKAVSSYKPRFIKKHSSSSLNRKEIQEKGGRNQEFVYLKRAYFS